MQNERADHQMCKAEKSAAEYRNTLNAAKMATFDRAPKTEAAMNWVHEILKETLAYEDQHNCRKRVRRQKDLITFSQAVGAFAADLLRNSGNEKAKGYMYRSANREELATSLVTSDNFTNLVEIWTDLQLIEATGSIDARTDFDGGLVPYYRRARRFRSTQAFLDLAAQYQITSSNVKDNFEISHRHAKVVQVRATKGSNPFDPTRGKSLKPKGIKFNKCRDQVLALNKLMQTHEYNLSEPPMVRRVFNCGDRADFDFNLGGRFYCASEDNWMEKSKDDRNLILIDGQPTCEIDVRASHLSILYAMTGGRLSFETDPYDVGGYPREIVKQVIVTAIGAGKLPLKWPREFAKAYERDHGYKPNGRFKLKDIVSAVLGRHSVLDSLKQGQLDWANLQYEEAECFLAAMLDLHENYGIPSLPVHDSLIIRYSDTPSACEALFRAYKDRLGFQPVIPMPKATSGS